MTYSIKQLADISGVSTRTLRHYDEIGLLKPACYGENGYRYYSEEELLLLQQILFYRALDFKLSDITAIITADDFDKLKSLEMQKQQLLSKLSHTKNLIDTIDKTLQHLRGEIKMKEIDMFLAFKHPQQLEMADHIKQEMGEAGERIVAECKDKIKQLTPEDFFKIEKDIPLFVEQAKKLMAKRISPDSAEAQSFIDEHYSRRVKPFCTVTANELIKLTEIDVNLPSKKKKFDDVHSDFANFFLEAVKVFAEKNLILRE